LLRRHRIDREKGLHQAAVVPQRLWMLVREYLPVWIFL
jgi:hypothetical protein